MPAGYTHVIFWKFEGVAAPSMCDWLEDWVAERSLGMRSDRLASKKLAARTASAVDVAVVCQSRPPRRWVQLHAPEKSTLHFVLLRRPFDMACSMYASLVHNRRLAARVAPLRRQYERAGLWNESATARQHLYAKQQVALQPPDSAAAVEFLEFYFGSSRRAAKKNGFVGALNRSASNFVDNWYPDGDFPGTAAGALRSLDRLGGRVQCLLFERLRESFALLQLRLGDSPRWARVLPPQRAPRAPWSAWPAAAKAWYETDSAAGDARLLYHEFERRFEAQIDTVGRARHAAATACLAQLAASKAPHRASEQMVDVGDVEAGLQGRVWLVSHGGVGSEYLRDLLFPKFGGRGTDSPFFIPKDRVSAGARRPFRSVAAHLPAPPRTGPRAALYVYGAAVEAVLSQVGRHADNAAKLHNDERYPLIQTLQDLFRIQGPDPFGIEGQFRRFAAVDADYPVFYLRHDALTRPVLQAVDRELKMLTGEKTRLYEYVRHDHASVALFKSADIQNVQKLYGDLDLIFAGQPPLALFWPKNHASATAERRYDHLENIRNLLRRQRGCDWPTAAALDADLAAGRVRITHASGLGAAKVFNIRFHARMVAKVAVAGPRGTYVLPAETADTGKTGKGCTAPANRRWYGFEDPRTFDFGGLPFVLMHGQFDDAVGAEYLLNVTSRQHVRLWVPRVAGDTAAAAAADLAQLCAAPAASSGAAARCVERDWVPYSDRGRLRFVSWFNETGIGAILQVADFATGRCDVVHGDPRRNYDGAGVGGGTPLIQWVYPFYAGLAQIRNATDLVNGRESATVNGREKYGAVPMLVDVEHKAVFLGAPLSFPAPTHDLAQPRRGTKDVQSPYHLALHSDAVRVSVGVEFQERYPVTFIFNITEFAKLLPPRKRTPAGNDIRIHLAKARPRRPH
ncbi:hypothetical protein M885DRAFT_511066 [Pelagophyceae sp. CCMP2097]|nr:hypothetical protein M885DRAFT_511066 [Pelagophyceae sp. CCMP2097]